MEVTEEVATVVAMVGEAQEVGTVAAGCCSSLRNLRHR